MKQDRIKPNLNKKLKKEREEKEPKEKKHSKPIQEQGHIHSCTHK